MIQLSQIWIYPIKSLGGISLQESKVTDRGLELDRRWLLVDGNSRFLSQREYPKLALFQPEIAGDFLQVIDREQGDSIAFLHHPIALENKTEVTVWDDSIVAFEVSSSISSWFTQKLGFPTRLVYMPHESRRLVAPEYAVAPSAINSFSDGYPFLLIGQSALDDLNARLANPVPMNRFRPNFVMTNTVAFEEESWREFRIGSVDFVGVKPCERCIMTTVDQEKGTLSGKDPLKTLATYRKFENKVLFGQNAIGLGLGTVVVGDVCTVFGQRE
ncbi:MOSC domain-containing protein [Flavobacterium restrictum]|uniref:MOSC domain-containing protein n=1 Tax=Flavobacterium restrictum TaxID=2594428 RepID=A0A553E2E6_9FLAO|nr:MOSC N-terminal beta barrel domain-containing protein [Flavobacterium restrictum]TRX39033.1 MOSC domain-containing protein [Flavobacterium restrictum]